MSNTQSRSSLKRYCGHNDNENNALVDLPMTLAASLAEVTLYGAWNPLLDEKKAGKSLESELNEATVTPSVSRYSSVRSISRMDFTPAHTTATGVLPSSVKSALTSRAVCTSQHVYEHVCIGIFESDVHVYVVCVCPCACPSMKAKGIYFLLFSPSLCTPPIPPVTNTGMPAL